VSTPTVLLVGPRAELLEKTVKLGLTAVALQTPGRFRPAHAELAEAALLVDWTDWELVRPLIAAAHDAFEFTAVVCTLEPGLETGGRITDLLGLRGNSYAVNQRLRDKWAMRESLAASGAGGIVAEPVSDAAGLEAFGRRHGYPLIVKPVDGSASLGVVRVDGPEQLAEAWDAVSRLRGSSEHLNAEFFPLDRFIVEQYIEGPEYSVEAFSFDGRHVVVAVTQKLTLPGFIEVGHALPARLDDDVERAIVASVTEFLDAMGVQQGPTHTELKLAGETPYIIESHTRAGGDRIVDLVKHAFGIDLEEYALAWAAGVWPALERRPEPRAAAATRFIVGEPGTVTAIRGVDEARGVDGVLDVSMSVAEGDTVRSLGASWDRIGQVIASGPDPERALASCEEAIARISVVTEPQP
jgi:biotin carboxylase